MTSAGNDIVSLTAINVTRTKSPEFYSKIISNPENELYEKINPEILPFEYFIWLLWSVKESAFKNWHRINPKVLFIPVKFVVSLLEVPENYHIANFGTNEITGQGFNDLISWNSVVSYGDDTLYSKTLIYKEFILTAVNHSENFENVYWGIKRIAHADYKSQSAAVRRFAVNKLEEVLGINGLVIGKNDENIPLLINANEEMDAAVSLSHHEQWVGYSFCFPHLYF